MVVPLGPPIDFAYLAQQTLGDVGLELELLRLFRSQGARILAQLQAPSSADAAAQADLAHTLKGAALAVGAGRVAAAAEAYEALVTRTSDDVADAWRDLASVVTEAIAAIDLVLAR